MLDRDDRRCIVCGADAVDVHHVVPVSLGGSDDEGNLVSTCVACHRDLDHEAGRIVVAGHVRGVGGSSTRHAVPKTEVSWPRKKRQEAGSPPWENGVMGDVDRFEVFLRGVVVAGHNCDCDRCQQRQRDDRWRAVGVWLLLSPEEQRDWLAYHERDELGAMLERALIEAAEDGRDVVALHDEFERRRPVEET